MNKNVSGPSLPSPQELEELKWKMRESKPSFQFMIATNDLKALRAAQMRCSNLSTQLRDAFDIAIREVKDRLHILVDNL